MPQFPYNNAIAGIHQMMPPVHLDFNPGFHSGFNPFATDHKPFYFGSFGSIGAPDGSFNPIQFTSTPLPSVRFGISRSVMYRISMHDSIDFGNVSVSSSDWIETVETSTNSNDQIDPPNLATKEEDKLKTEK